MYSQRMKTIGTRLDEAMKAAGFESQSALARASSVPQPTINRILKGGGERGPEAATVRKLAETCNVSFEWLNEGIGERSRSALRLAHSARQDQDDQNLLNAAHLLELIDLFRRATPDGRRFILDSAAAAPKNEGTESLIREKQV
jgi:transcriptional regulator with XRE-family HTH domain